MIFNSNKDRVDHFIGNKKSFYAFMLRKGFFMPDIKQSICSIDFMDRGFREELFIPKQTQVHPI